MLPLAKQVQIACDAAKFGAARLAGETAPSYEDNEATLAELKARIDKTVSWLQQLRGGADRRQRGRARCRCRCATAIRSSCRGRPT